MYVPKPFSISFRIHGNVDANSVESIFQVWAKRWGSEQNLVSIKWNRAIQVQRECLNGMTQIWIDGEFVLPAGYHQRAIQSLREAYAGY